MKKLFIYLVMAVLIAAVCVIPSEAKTETITIWAMGMEGMNLSKIIPQFEKANPGIKVKLQQIPWGGAHEKIITAIAGNSVPDICQMGSTWMAEFSSSNVFQALDGYINKSQIVKKDNYFKAAIDICMYKGKMYGIPWYVDARIIFYRTDVLKEIGYSKFPEDWDQFRDCLRKLKARGPDSYALTTSAMNYQEFMNFVWQNGGRILNQKGRPAVTEPAFVDAMTWYVGLFNEKLALLDTGGTNFRQDLNSGRFPIAIGGPWEIGNMEREYPELEGKWSLAMFPKNVKTGRRDSFFGGCEMVIFKGAKQKNAAWKFMEYFCKPEVQVSWAKINRNLPCLKTAWDDPYFKNDPKMQVVFEQLKYGHAPDNVPQWAQIEDRIQSRFQEACYQKRTPKEVCQTLEQELKKIMGL